MAGSSSSWWERITSPREQQERQLAQQLGSKDYEGAVKLDAFQDCLQDHKMRVIGASALVTLPWSLHKRSTTPLLLGTIVAVLPDAMYANWRCDEQYRAFAAHVKEHSRQLLETADKDAAAAGARS